MYRVRAVWTGVAGSPYYSNFYFTEEGGTAAQARLAVATFLSSIRSVVADNVTYVVENEVPVIDEATGDVIRVDFDAVVHSAAGQSTATMLPLSNQMLLRLRTGVFIGGREIRGRFFIPGQVVTSANDGTVLLATATAVQGFAATLIGSANAQWVVYAKTKGTYAVINAANVWNQFAVLTSRRD